MDKGRCKHGEFPLLDGCYLCIEERRAWEAGQSTGDAPPSVGSTTAPDILTEATTRMEKAFENLEAVEASQSTALVKIKPETDILVNQFYHEALKAKEYAEARVIATVDDLTPATDDLSLIAKLKKAMEEKRKEYVKPLQDHVKDVNDTFKTLMEPIETADTVTRNKILTFQLKQKLIREEQEKINALRMEAAKLDASLHNGEISESVGLVEVTPELAKRTVTDMGIAGMRDNWKWEVVAIELVPREYLMINSGMLTPIVKASKGRITIPGIRIYNEPIIAVNTK